jgi:hypothetical protein
MVHPLFFFVRHDILHTSCSGSRGGTKRRSVGTIYAATPKNQRMNHFMKQNEKAKDGPFYEAKRKAKDGPFYEAKRKNKGWTIL